MQQCAVCLRWPNSPAAQLPETVHSLKETLMDNSSLRRPLWALASVVLLTFSGLAAAEPPSRAARLGFISGTVSFSPAGQPDWVRAAVNRPLTTGDRLWTAALATGCDCTKACVGTATTAPVTCWLA